MLTTTRNPGITYVKRVAAIPGDRIAVKENAIILNGQPVPRSETPCPPSLSEISAKTAAAGAPRTCYEERFPGSKTFTILQIGGRWQRPDFDEITVPADHYFVLGDNRDNSVDSRLPEVGLIPRANIFGKAAFMFFSVGLENRAGGEIVFPRWDRMFTIPQ